MGKDTPSQSETPEIETPEIETWYVDDIDPALALEISKLLCTVWPKPDRTPESRAQQLAEEQGKYSGPKSQAPRSFLMREHGRVIAHSAILPRKIRTSQGEHVVAGLAKVCSDPKQRGRGLGERIVRAALQVVDSGEFEVMLFQTSIEVRPFYEKHGAREIENRIVNSLADDPDANPFWDRVVMIYPSDAEWPEGVVDLLGPGF
ncbi:MAG: GNAT family N-acetyltransferase [Lacipirellulaceae bacterium]